MFMLISTEEYPAVATKPALATKTIGQNVGFERTRRITGYLVGTLDRFNNGKRAEEKDRVKHGA